MPSPYLLLPPILLVPCSNLMCSQSVIVSQSIFLKGGTVKYLSIDFALLMSLFNVVTKLSLGLPLCPFSNLSK